MTLFNQPIQSNKTITVIDSIMGTGKTSYSIQMMKEAPEVQKFIFITPFLDEVERIKLALPERNFKEPSKSNKKGAKLEGLKQLLVRGENIASTHALFKRCDEEVIELLKANGYILILDEVAEVVEQMEIVEEDIDILFKSGTIIEDEGKWIKWVGTTREYKGALKDVMESCYMNNVYRYGKKFYMWTFPVEVFQSFSKVYVLTYMFDGSLQKYYFDLFNQKYEYKSVERIDNRYELIDYVENYDMSVIAGLLNIYEGTLNDVGNDRTAFSMTKLDRMAKEKSPLLKVIQKNIYNYFKYIAKCKANERMWTTYKDHKNSLKGDGYTKQFLACNSRATNQYKDRTTMAYVCNRFVQPSIKNFFTAHGIEINEDRIALSELVQWIFRSAIREGKEVNIYIPSSRMRRLLKEWLGE
ncbi:MAG: hypothetical protein K0S61_2550 [Anaerocolumna sp.]|jgi:hypothetical protein|nr:hypothetical protein [Anaerocolumna sp.]